MGKVKRNIKFYSISVGRKYRTDDQESIIFLKDKKEIAYAVINGFKRIMSFLSP